jgi:hypothetical protein
MATDKTYTVAGISKLNGDYKVRFANDMMRIKILAKSGHEDIRLVELGSAMTKLAAAQHIRTHGEFSDATAQATIAEYLADHGSATSVKKAAVTPQVKAVPGMTPLGIGSVEMEDTPF